ncbi:hypothetical protein C7C45_16195 [Micromonospora arborensis]|uniref:Uncharacterized protein n=1 Tax=Micromonospora arborensis TaxID=2116518 RepID=A0A318NI38_9ACTN|nr:hypothetical protein C7C45_16195 [Micromonospora arborensis]
MWTLVPSAAGPPGICPGEEGDPLTTEDRTRDGFADFVRAEIAGLTRVTTPTCGWCCQRRWPG